MLEISDEKLRAIIRESVQTILEGRKKGLLTEMHYPRSQYKEKVNPWKRNPRIFLLCISKFDRIRIEITSSIIIFKVNY